MCSWLELPMNTFMKLNLEKKTVIKATNHNLAITHKGKQSEGKEKGCII
jgi:hypothetical protein